MGYEIVATRPSGQLWEYKDLSQNELLDVVCDAVAMDAFVMITIYVKKEA